MAFRTDALWNRATMQRCCSSRSICWRWTMKTFGRSRYWIGKQRLSKLLSKDRTGIRYIEHLDGDGPTIFEHACKLGLEGIVSKRVDLPYEPGPSRGWQKVKNKEHPSMQRVREAFE
jgi:hypothetical protein